ncbi:MAG: HAD-IA family hydrolase [Rhodocyclaceae bacterium]|nr:HAD-IA family hydrolase [Rhodocyclaceae bacterium]
MIRSSEARRLEAVIFDVDGTLADTEEAHRQAFNQAFAEFGLSWRWDAALYRELLAVTGGKERIAHYARNEDPAWMARAEAEETIARLHRRKTALYAEMVEAGRVQARPGVAALLAALRREGVRVAIATTTSRANVEVLLAKTLAEVPADTFEVMGCGEEAAAKKPAPDIYLWVLERLGLPAAACLAIEDSKNGVLAARAAGVPVLVSESSWTTGEDFSGAVAVLPDLSGVTVEALRRWHAQATT